MTDELLFRILFSGLWLVYLANVIWVSRAAKWSHHQQTPASLTRLRIVAILFGVLYYAGALLYALVPSWIMFLSIPLPDWFRVGIGCVAILGMFFTCWGFWVLGRNWAPCVSGVRKDTVLVTSGPYGYVRHPIYLGAFIFIVALAFVAANLLVLLPTLVLIVLLYASIGKEESLLTGRFGDEYREYMKRTPRFIPKFRHMHPTPQQPKQPS
ncbi:MAG TPA: isoprenylcysteine carboxylmethyltransferase family protein [Candidatus Dormibacteraeota bacterium]|nr:isoprenylcysteine carboxylmethyltransferase family protein [Candidatus Dormibacteraeota bacterium]